MTTDHSPTTADTSPTITALRAELDTARQAYEQFRTRARDAAIQAHHDGHWNLDALNTTFTDLCLDPYTPRYTYEATVELPLVVRFDEETQPAHEVIYQHAERIQRAVRAALDNLDDLPVELVDVKAPYLHHVSRVLVGPE